MVSKNNFAKHQEQLAKLRPHYGLRKLSVGVSSVLLSTTFYLGLTGTAHADTVGAVGNANGVGQATGAGNAVATTTTVAPVVKTPVQNQPVVKAPVQNQPVQQPVVKAPVQNQPGQQPVVKAPVQARPVQPSIVKAPVQNQPVQQSVVKAPVQTSTVPMVKVVQPTVKSAPALPAPVAGPELVQSAPSSAADPAVTIDAPAAVNLTRVEASATKPSVTATSQAKSTLVPLKDPAQVPGHVVTLDEPTTAGAGTDPVKAVKASSIDLTQPLATTQATKLALAALGQIGAMNLAVTPTTMAADPISMDDLSGNDVVALVKEYGVTPNTNKILNLKTLGVIGDGKTDVTAGIQAALNQLKTAGGGILYIPQGTYMVQATNATDEASATIPWQSNQGLMVPSNTTIVLANNAKLQVIPNASWNYTLLNLNSVHDVNVLGGELVGDNQGHQITYTQTWRNRVSYDGETGWGIMLADAQKVTIRGMYIHDFWGDGIDLYGNNYDAAHPEFKVGDNQDVTISNNTITNNRRQGISIENANRVTISENVISNNGGTAPGAGIDVEPSDWANTGMRHADNVTITNNYFADNDNAGVFTYALSTGAEGFEDGASSIDNLIVKGNTFDHNNTNSVAIEDQSGWNWQQNMNGQLTILGVNNADVENNRIVNGNPAGVGVGSTHRYDAVVPANTFPDAGMFVGFSQNVKVQNNYLDDHSDIFATGNQSPNYRYDSLSGTIDHNYANAVIRNKTLDNEITGAPNPGATVTIHDNQAPTAAQASNFGVNQDKPGLGSVLLTFPIVVPNDPTTTPTTPTTPTKSAYTLILQDGAENNKQLLSKGFDTLPDYNQYVATNYPNYDVTAYALKDSVLTVTLGHKLQNGSDQKTVTRHIVMNMPTGPQSGDQTVSFVRTYQTDLVTGQKLNVSPWDPANYQFAAIEVPTVGGYHADGTVPAVAVTPDSGDTTVTINYVKDAATTPSDPNQGSTSQPTDPDQGQPTTPSTTVPKPTDIDPATGLTVAEMTKIAYQTGVEVITYDGNSFVSTNGGNKKLQPTDEMMGNWQPVFTRQALSKDPKTGEITYGPWNSTKTNVVSPAFSLPALKPGYYMIPVDVGRITDVTDVIPLVGATWRPAPWNGGDQTLTNYPWTEKFGGLFVAHSYQQFHLMPGSDQNHLALVVGDLNQLSTADLNSLLTLAAGKPIQTPKAEIAVSYVPKENNWLHLILHDDTTGQDVKLSADQMAKLDSISQFLLSEHTQTQMDNYLSGKIDKSALPADFGEPILLYTDYSWQPVDLATLATLADPNSTLGYPYEDVVYTWAQLSGDWASLGDLSKGLEIPAVLKGYQLSDPDELQKLPMMITEPGQNNIVIHVKSQPKQPTTPDPSQQQVTGWVNVIDENGHLFDEGTSHGNAPVDQVLTSIPVTGLVGQTLGEATFPVNASQNPVWDGSQVRNLATLYKALDEMGFAIDTRPAAHSTEAEFAQQKLLADGANTYYLYVYHKTQAESRPVSADREILFEDADTGAQIAPEQIQHVEGTQTGTLDLVTKLTTWEPFLTPFQTVTAPTIAGYDTPDPAVVPAMTPSADQLGDYATTPIPPVIIKYHKTVTSQVPGGDGSNVPSSSVTSSGTSSATSSVASSSVDSSAVSSSSVTSSATSSVASSSVDSSAVPSSSVTSSSVASSSVPSSSVTSSSVDSSAVPSSSVDSSAISSSSVTSSSVASSAVPSSSVTSSSVASSAVPSSSVTSSSVASSAVPSSSVTSSSVASSAVPSSSVTSSSVASSAVPSSSVTSSSVASSAVPSSTTVSMSMLPQSSASAAPAPLGSPESLATSQKSSSIDQPMATASDGQPTINAGQISQPTTIGATPVTMGAQPMNTGATGVATPEVQPVVGAGSAPAAAVTDMNNAAALPQTGANDEAVLVAAGLGLAAAEAGWMLLGYRKRHA